MSRDVPTSNVASRSPSTTSISLVPPSSRCTSQALDGTSTFWPSASMLTPEVTHRQAVGVGRHQAQPAGLCGQEHAGEDRAGVVVATPPAPPGAGPSAKPSASSARPRRSDGSTTAAGTRRRADSAHAEPRATGDDAHLVAGLLDRRRRRARARARCRREPRRHHGHAVARARHVASDPDGELEVGAGQLAAGPRRARCARPSEHRAARRRDCDRCAAAVPTASASVSRSQRNFTSAFLLHAMSYERDSSGSRGCGLWTNGTSVQVSAHHAVPPSSPGSHRSGEC